MSCVAQPHFMLDYALEYADRGVPVFPLQPRGKIPFAGTHGLKDATTGPNAIRDWWHVEHNPDANIGAATGHVFDVLDIDGQDALGALADAAGFDDTNLLTTGPVVQTVRGWHLYFEPYSPNRAGFVPGCDWRGLGGYAVMPPSLRTREYAWLETDDGVHNLDRELEPVPEWLAALLVPSDPALSRRVADVPARAGTGSRGFWSKFVTPKSAQYFAAALEDEARAVAGASVGTRNDQLNRSTHTLARLDIDAATIETVMWAAALEAGLSDHEALATINSALRARGLA